MNQCVTIQYEYEYARVRVRVRVRVPVLVLLVLIIISSLTSAIPEILSLEVHGYRTVRYGPACRKVRAKCTFPSCSCTVHNVPYKKNFVSQELRRRKSTMYLSSKSRFPLASGMRGFEVNVNNLEDFTLVIGKKTLPI